MRAIQAGSLLSRTTNALRQIRNNGPEGTGELAKGEQDTGRPDFACPLEPTGLVR
jgi:hypothetical protein